MRKIFYTIVILSALGSQVWAQSDSRITAILDKEPANKATELNANAVATAALGESGITAMLNMLQPNGTADNTHIYDAISGFSYYVTQNGKEAWRALAVKAYSKALPHQSDDYNRAFIISQLQIVGKDDAVATLKKYLNDDHLCDPAARALVKVNSVSAKAALLSALKTAQGDCKISLVEALGDIKNTLAVKSINAVIGRDKKLTKVALYALANIASPVSINLMANAAQNVGLTYDETNATSSYLLYIENLGKHGQKATAIRLAKTLQTKASLAGQVQTETAALKLQADMQGAASTSLLIRAMQDNNEQFRKAALKFAAPYLAPAAANAWIATMQKADNTRKAEIITMLGLNHVQAALPAVVKEIKNEDAGVALAAIKASQQIGQDKVLNDLLAVLNSGNADEIAAVRDALMVMKGKTVVDKTAKALPDANPQAQVALIAVLAERRAHSKIDIIMPLLNSTDASVRLAAYNSLKEIAGEDNLSQLFALLTKTTQADETAAVQAAIISVFGQMKDTKGQSAMALEQMNAAPAARKPLYFNILASIGDKASLAAVSKAYDGGDLDTKKAAVTALSQWADGSAVRELVHIGKDAADAGLQNRIMRGLVGLIGKSAYPADEKVIFLREAMDIARNTDQRKLVLEELANDKTYVALLYAGRYLDDPQLQTEASAAVVSIGLSNPAFYGNDVRTIMNKVIAMRRGGDGDYEREAIKKFVAEMPNDDGFVDLFNYKDLTGWKGLVENPIARSKMDAGTLAKAQQKADSIMRKGWYVKDSILNFSGEGENICTIKRYRNFDMYVDWKIEPKGDAGIYLRGSPQVQVWDTSRVDVGAQVGSGGLYNNHAHESKPLKLADNAIGEWNSFHIIMKDDKVTVYLNGVLVVDNVVMDNYWDRKLPIFPKEQIELQAHGNHVYYRDIYLKELPD
ncbi:DUF1080 domain-containing protein [Mucilaginibacter ginsenosidivorans]|uniref:DUF1080 domain-containing protein n=1 Tax=Mucilaginibacter ginsenosidivorans TaxID=398053 RepID=A0A5B8UVE1_9SPHI|nr:family 16 glycoside hydrolase [Mucilaginibacter ginsenosidivorans]QEC62705.1 DUF1080 domain-containing protein [Mucilaginibacter ginsenosidivorans]